MKRPSIRMAPVVILIVLTLLPCARAARIEDMYGRSVALPERIGKVVGASPPVTYLLYTLDAGLVGGLNLPPSRKLARFLGGEVEKMPVIGGFGGAGKNYNAEVLLAAGLDLVIAWPPHGGTLNPQVRRLLNASGIPYVLLKLDTIHDYPAAYAFLGKLLGQEERGKKLAAYLEKELNALHAHAAAIPESNRVSVYFAEGRDGLTTVSSDSVHGEALALAGGRNVYRVKHENRRLKDHISLEQLLVFDPQVIIVQEPSFFRHVQRDRRWRDIRAVREGKVYLEPDTPFSWMDRPPSFLRLMGAKWLTERLYPQRGGEKKLLADTREFFQLFLGTSLGDDEMRALLNRGRRPSEREPSGKKRP
jgi:iron complex transport system substrate-binding protein